MNCRRVIDDGGGGGDQTSVYDAISLTCLPGTCLPPSTHTHNGLQSLAHRLAQCMSQFLLPANPAAAAAMSSSTDDQSPTQREKAAGSVNPLLVQFVRVFLCHCPDERIRESAYHILGALYR